jgi:hypothetical protein
MRMSKKAQVALEGSIEKWYIIITASGVDRGPDNCPLCAEFRVVVSRVSCNGCPVKQATGRHGCNGTPHVHFNDADMDASGTIFEYGELSQEKLEYALEELLFLRSLHPNILAYDKKRNAK